MSDERTRHVVFEDALLTAIRSALPEARTVDTFPGDVEDAVEYIKSLGCPAVLTMYAGGEYENPTDPDSDEEAEWVVLVAVKNLRGNKEALRGQEGRQGAYDYVQAIRDALAGVRLVSDACMPTEVRRCTLVGVDGGLALYQLSVGVRLNAYTVED